MDSILITIRKMLGIQSDFDGFDTDIIVAINTALMSLNQLGIGPSNSFKITGIEELWTSLLGEVTDFEAVKSYIYLKTRLMFDPPSNSFLVDAITRQITELEWRLNVQVENILVE